LLRCRQERSQGQAPGAPPEGKLASTWIPRGSAGPRPQRSFEMQAHPRPRCGTERMRKMNPLPATFRSQDLCGTHFPPCCPSCSGRVCQRLSGYANARRVQALAPYSCPRAMRPPVSFGCAMHWILALAGAVVGAMAGSASAAFLGLTAGTLLGWQWGRIRTLGRHLEEVEARVRVLQSIQSAGTKATPPAAVQEVVAPSPDAGEPGPPRSVDIPQPAAAQTPPAAAPVHTLAVGSGPEPPTPSIVAGDDDPDSSGASMGGRHTAPAADAIRSTPAGCRSACRCACRCWRPAGWRR